jgi:HK97 family phage major capsid protein
LTFAAGEIYANVAASQRLLDDSQINFEQFIADNTAEEFARQEGIAFISGNGTNKPNGLLTYAVGAANAAAHPGGALDTVTAASASAITGDDLIGFAYGLAAPYRQNASWLMNSATAAMLMKLKDSNNNYLLREGLAAGAPATLLGRPIVFDENVPSVAASAIVIAFGDFSRGYLINDRTGVRVLRDAYTNKPFVMFYSTRRVGGGLLDPRAIRVLKMAAS